MAGVPNTLSTPSPNASRQSEQLARQHALSLELGFQVDRAYPGFNVKMEFAEDLTPVLVDALLERLAAEHCDVWQTISAVRFRRWPSQDASPIRSIAYPGIDRRAGKILRRKSEQLSMEVQNIVVIDVGAVGGSILEWRSAIQRMLQPTKNRRIGVVVLFQSLYSVHLDRGSRSKSKAGSHHAEGLHASRRFRRFSLPTPAREY